MLSLRFTLPPNTTTLSNKNQCKLRRPKIVACNELPKGLQRELMPKHVALIMDGHRRWAKENGKTAEQGHRAGAEKISALTRLFSRWGVKVFSLFAFSTENWIRPSDEVDFLMKLFLEQASSQTNVDELIRNGVRVSFIGDKSKLPKQLTKIFTLVEEKTKSNSGMHWLLALNYGGQHDILQATRKIASKVKDGVVQVEDIDKSLFEQHLETNIAEFPNPDLLIRTSGMQRISNFMLWQLGYSELYFAHKLFPDMEEADFIDALIWFQQRQRRYGGQKF